MARMFALRRSGDILSMRNSDNEIERQVSDVSKALAFDHVGKQVQRVLLTLIARGLYQLRERDMIKAVQITGSECQ
jgi:hypothetical protein